MPPKKPVVEQKILLGRPSNNVKMGIVGLPNVGKSTTFNIMSNLSVPAENFPFCTIDPNTARVSVTDARFDWLCNHYQPASRVAATLTIVDIAGLVRGASTGAGLGNAFLSHIKAVDGIYHVVRTFDDPDIIHTEGEIDPIRDLDIIHEELLLKDIEYVDDRVHELDRIMTRGLDKSKKAEWETMKKVQEWLHEKKCVRDGNWQAKEVEILNQHQFITAKPVVYLANLSEADYKRKKNKWLVKIHQWVQEHGGGTIIPYSAGYEANVHAVPEGEERAKFIEDQGVPSMMTKIVTTGYHELHLIHFFTAGPDEVRCWTIRDLTKAPQAAGVIHTDFEKGFICAEVFKYTDLVELGSEGAVKAGGKYRQQGKEYTVEDGDVILFKFNVTTEKKK
eukprot:GILI01002718.1.p1 GENE.GILI01002718.1~~GILI01002718.1.p1  ORF type:complete len:392 (+),score=142.28 GILI01002718.1:48-1223(+)